MSSFDTVDFFMVFDTFTAYVEDRRREPRQDVLTQLATAKYPDGTTHILRGLKSLHLEITPNR